MAIRGQKIRPGEEGRVHLRRRFRSRRFRVFGRPDRRRCRRRTRRGISDDGLLPGFGPVFRPEEKGHQEALDIFRKALKPGDPRIADSLNNLGIVQRALRDYEGSRKSHEEALDIRSKALPEGHPALGATARSSQRQRRGATHPHVATALTSSVLQRALTTTREDISASWR